MNVNAPAHSNIYAKQDYADRVRADSVRQVAGAGRRQNCLSHVTDKRTNDANDAQTIWADII